MIGRRQIARRLAQAPVEIGEMIERRDDRGAHRQRRDQDRQMQRFLQRIDAVGRPARHVEQVARPHLDDLLPIRRQRRHHALLPLIVEQGRLGRRVPALAARQLDRDHVIIVIMDLRPRLPPAPEQRGVHLRAEHQLQRPGEALQRRRQRHHVRHPHRIVALHDRRRSAPETPPAWRRAAGVGASPCGVTAWQSRLPAWVACPASTVAAGSGPNIAARTCRAPPGTLSTPLPSAPRNWSSGSGSSTACTIASRLRPIHGSPLRIAPPLAQSRRENLPHCRCSRSRNSLRAGHARMPPLSWPRRR